MYVPPPGLAKLSASFQCALCQILLAIFAADVDGDRDLGVLGAGPLADVTRWCEDTAGDGSAWAEHVVSGTFDGASSVFAAAVDLGQF